MEEMIMILLFALSASLCLWGFVAAKNISEENLTRDRAVTEAQNMAELIKHHKGDFYLAAEELGGEVTKEDEWNICFTGKEDLSGEKCILSAKKTESGTDGLGRAEITFYSDDTEVYSLTVGWQTEDDR